MVFGSYLRKEVANLNDIDIAVDLANRFGNSDKQKAVMEAYIQQAIDNGRQFKTHLDELFFPETHVKAILRNKSRYISLHPITDQVLTQTEMKQIYPEGQLA